MYICVRPSLGRRSERLWINIEVVAKGLSFGNDLLCSDLFVGLASVRSWSAPRPLASGEDAILVC
jgi:hypothetical protein